jgi:uncharacterized OB-fold protein
VNPEVVSGEGVIESYTTVTNGEGDSTVAVWVRLIDQPEIRLTSSLRNVTLESVQIGMAVMVAFEQHGEVFLPVFKPADPRE